MAALSTRVTITMIDRYKRKCTIVFHMDPGVIDPTDSRITNIVAKINAFCNPVGLFIELSQDNVVIATATVGAAYISEDKGLFPALDVDGQAHNFKVPGIKAAIITPGSDTIDMTNTDVIAYVAAVTGNALGRGGAAVSTMASGYRTASRKPIKN